MGKINLVYWNALNFGDLLSPYIIQKLTGKEICRKELYVNYKRSFNHLLKYLLSHKFENIASVHMPYEANLLAIGSIISFGNSRSLIWGSGFMNENEPFHGGHVFAVRGKFTDKKLQELGYKGCTVYGDPALLLPLLLNGNTQKKNFLGIIPHWKEVNIISQKYGRLCKIIDLRTNDIERVVKEITSCRYILSTSLHGIIVAHAYGVPALWIKEGDINTDGIKFNDYFSSVGIVPYFGFSNIINSFSTNEDIELLFLNNQDKILPNISLDIIQRQLLKAAPFKLLEKYKVE